MADGFAADLSGAPAGLRDAVASALGRSVDDGPPVPVPRRPRRWRAARSALVRTDPVVAALAGYVLNAALDRTAGGPRPARRCGVIRTGAVAVRTTLLLVRYRFHLNCPPARANGSSSPRTPGCSRSPARPRTATWLPPEQALALLAVGADANTDPPSRERTMRRVLDGLDGVGRHLMAYGDELAAELLASHRRVRSASGEIVRGAAVSAQKPADVLGAYVYLPVGAA